MCATADQRYFIKTQKMFFKVIVLISYSIVLLLFGVNSMNSTNSMDNIQIECDAISTHTDFGRRFCFYRHIKIEPTTRVTIMENPIADEKNELIFDNCTLFTLPSGIFVQFPHIRTVYVWNVQLQLVKPEIFQNAKELFMLDLSRNRIEHLVAHTFSLAPNLQQLDLTKNLIRAIDVNTFSGLKRLNVLKLNENQLTLMPANVFAPLPQLKIIRLNHNLIKTIPMELFAENVQLENIYLNDNAIEWMVGEQTFRHLNSVREFDLHNNPILNLNCCVINAESIDIRHTNAKCCYIGRRTKRILANDNRISIIDIENGSSTQLQSFQLNFIDLANNKLTQMTNLTYFNELKYLDLSNNNQIADIGLNSFANMKQLELLNLRNSGLSRIYFGSFSHKPHLKRLDISYNLLNRIQINKFVSMPNLKSLYLDANNLSDIDITEMGKVFPSLTKIGISNNNWTCDNLASVIKYLDSNGIEFDSDGNVKNHENIKGIPCNNINSVDSDAVDKLLNYNNNKNFTSTSIETENEANLKNTSVSENEIKAQHKCKSEMELIIRLLDLKYQSQTAIDNARLVAEKVDNMIDLLQVP